MKLIVNGNPREVEAATLAALLAALDYGDAVVATALNGAFVPAKARAATPVADGDAIEIVAPMRGG